MWVCSSGNRKINITHRANSGNPQHVTGIPHKLICIIFDCFLLLYSIEKIQRLWIARQMLYSSGSHRARLFWTQVLQQWMRGERKYLPAMEVVAINTSIFKTVLISPPIYSTHIYFQRWLDPSKSVQKQWSKEQKNFSPSMAVLEFRVKFYISDPSRLQEEFTRYQFYLQIKNDIWTGRLPSTLTTACLLASYQVQCECFSCFKLAFRYSF